MNFVHLKTYSEYSLSQGINRVSDLVTKSSENKMPALALTELNGLFSVIEFYQEARAKGIKPIIGIDISVEQDDGNIYQLTLLAKNDNGYKNLVFLNSRGYLENRKPNNAPIKEEWLVDLKDVIVLSGAKQGLLGQKILSNKMDEAIEIAKQMKSVFGEDFYIELQRDGSPQEEAYMDGAVEISQRLKIASVATHPALFQNSSDFVAHEARFCISNKYSLFDMERPRPFNKEMYFKTPEEMSELFSDLPQALENTLVIAKKCNTELSLGKPQLPNFVTPTGETPDVLFTSLAENGLEKRLKELFINEAEIEKNRDKYKKRLNIELKVIKEMGFPSYFLIVADFISWSKENDIPIGPGRGSGVGSLVAYSMGITDVDPLPHNLLFERFLNTERVSMPDFDIDMCKDRRGEIIEYVRKKYGENSVCQIGTFGTMAAKAVTRDVGRTLGYPYNFVDDLAKMILIFPNNPMTLKEFLFGNEEKGINPDEKLLARYNNEQDVKKLIDIALKIEGLTKNIGTHASGVIMSPTILNDFTSLFTLDSDSKPVSQLNMNDIEKAGLVKFDFLGLDTLTIIKNATDMIYERHGKKLEMHSIKTDDPEIFKNIFASGNTIKVFQFESKGMRSNLKKMRPDKFEDVAALNALYRPGPMEIISPYITSKFMKDEERDYGHPLLKDALKETYGFMIYQEQVMECAKIIAGYTLGGADLLRRAMGKKKPEEMKKQREIFILGAAKNNVNEQEASQLFDLIEKFAGYGFNKSHAVAYSFLAYQTAYLKNYYPEEFFSANLNSSLSDTDKLAVLLEDFKNNKGEIKNPDVNHSFYEFKIEGDKTIRYGLGAVKGVGEKAVQSIVQEREKNGKYLDFYDFLERVGKATVNKRVIEALVKAGSFDSINENRAQLYSSILEGLDYVTKFRKKQLNNISVLGNALDDPDPTKTVKVQTRKNKITEIIKPTLAETEAWDEITTAQNEKSCLGIYLTTNPYVNYYTKELDGFKASTPLAQLEDIYKDGYTEAYVGGIIEEIKWWKSKKGAFVRISDGTSTVEVRMYEDFLNSNKDWVKEGAFVSAKIKMDRKDSEDELGLSCQAGFSFEQTKKLLIQKVFVGIDNNEDNKQKFSEICDKYISSNTELNETSVVLCVSDEVTGRKTKKEKIIELVADNKLVEDLINAFGSAWVKPMYKQDVDNVRFPEVSSKRGKNKYYNNNRNAFVS